MRGGRWGLRLLGAALLAAVLAVTPSDGALGLVKLFAVAAYLCMLAAPSPCRSGGAYPFRHGFRAGAGCGAPGQSSDGTVNAASEAGTAPSTRLPSTTSAPEATSRNARG